MEVILDGKKNSIGNIHSIDNIVRDHRPKYTADRHKPADKEQPVEVGKLEPFPPDIIFLGLDHFIANELSYGE